MTPINRFKMDQSQRDQTLCGLRFVTIPRYQYGFGFTLRHFIIYPPDLYNERDAIEHHHRLGTVTEPVDTIFVKRIIENGPAARAGLCVGDRIVSVNGERIVGKSYDQVVHLIQKSTLKLYLEVSPKQYDTLQLFYEDKAYRPETNPRTQTGQAQLSTVSTQKLAHYPRKSQSIGYFEDKPESDIRNQYNYNSNASHESFFVDPPLYRNYYDYPRHQINMSSAFPNQQQQQQQFLSHLPRPTPYKSSDTTWSHLSTSSSIQPSSQLTQRQPRYQPQSYYPFQKPEIRDRNETEDRSLYGIREESSGTKSAESVLAGTTGSNNISVPSMTGASSGSNRYGSMECLGASPSEKWKNSPGYRFSISTGPEDVSKSSSEETFRRDSTISLEGSTSTTTNEYTDQQQSQPPQSQRMYVTMSGANEIYSDELNRISSITANNSQLKGYEVKMADRIRRSCEQKEEFLRRPNQPLQWVPNQSSSAATGFPKEFYAQPQKFQKVPWPPENKIVLVSTSGTQPSSSTSSVSDNIMTVTMRTPKDGKSYATSPHKIQIEQLRNQSASLDETTTRKQENLTNQLMQQQFLPKSSLNVNSTRINDGSHNERFSKDSDEMNPEILNSILQPSWTITDYAPTMLAKNRLTVVGGSKLHCDPPKDWIPTSVDEFGENSATYRTMDQQQMRPNYLQLPGTQHLVNAVARTRNIAPAHRNTPNRLDSNVVMRRKETDLDDNDRLVRRVSYLKATSSPIDMDRKNNTSPTTPTKSFEQEQVSLRKVGQGGNRRRSVAKLRAEFLVPKGRIIRLKQFFEDRTQPSSIFKFHYNSPTTEFRQFGAYISDRSPDNSDVLRDGQVHFKVRAGDAKKGGYYRSWRNGWAQLRRSGCVYLSKERLTKDAISGVETDVILCVCLKEGVVVEAADDYTKRKHVVRLKTSSVVPSSSGTSNEHQIIPVEILIQTDDPYDQLKWIQIFQQQQDNNNYANSNKAVIINPNELSSPKSSLLRSLVTSSQQSTTTSPYLTVSNPSTLQGTGGVSPKNKTWKGKVARQWKKMHLSSTNSSQNSTLGSFGQGSVAEPGATFGVMLEDCPQGDNNPVPKVLEFCVETVEERGLGVVGIYRIPGNNAAVTSLTESLNKGNEPNPDQDPRWKDVHVISSLLKSFLRKLPDPLLTSDHYPEFISAAADLVPEKALEKIRLLILDLPEPNFETLRYLIYHLRKVADNSEKNRMEARNLAIVFGPTVVRTSEENVTSLVNDMQHQCKIMELLINNVDEIFKEKDGESPTPEEETNISKPVKVVPAAPKIENEIKASLFQAAQRKVLQQAANPVTNIYGLPAAPRERPVDEKGLIRSYAGLGEETEQRVKQFEMETRAFLHRDARSPVLSNNTNHKKMDDGVVDPIQQKRITLEEAWKKAKDDLENEDFYDQLADNPSSIVQHRNTGIISYPAATHNLSSSSISSTNSGGTSLTLPYGVSTWPARLGPAPFKSQSSTPSLPPKPPHHSTQRASTVASAGSTLKKISSTEKLTGSSEKLITKSSEYLGNDSSSSTERAALKRLKNFESTNLHYDSKAFGSLDSLRDLANGSREDLSVKSSDESDLVTSITKTLEQKLELLRPNSITSDKPNVKDSNMTMTQKIEKNHCNGFDKSESEENAPKIPKRRNSMIDRRKSEITSLEKDKELEQISNRDPSLHRAHISGNSWSGPLDINDHDSPSNLTKEAKTVTNKLKRECRRRHSLNGTADIFRLMFGDVGEWRKKKSGDGSISNEAVVTTPLLTTNNILESHV